MAENPYKSPSDDRPPLLEVAILKFLLKVFAWAALVWFGILAMARACLELFSWAFSELR
jgi:hypothetical protein